jgi:hypothetical protein
VNPYAAARIFLALALVVGWMLGRRVPSHRPVTLALAALLVIDVVLAVGWDHLPRLALGGLFLAAYAVQAELAIKVLLPAVHPVWVGVGWAMAFEALTLRWDLAEPIYIVTFVVALSVQAIAAGIFWSEKRRGLPESDQGVALLFALSAVADMSGPWLAGQPVLHWSRGGGVAVLTYVTILIWEVYSWTVSSPRSSSSSSS